MEVVLRHLLPRGDRLGPRLGFSQKIDVLAAAWQGEGETIDNVCATLGGALITQAVVEEIGKVFAEVVHGIKSLFDAFQAKAQAKAIAND
ncbi:hypothetical protein [Sphingobium sp. EM0848]|uniref:hypothetical protein n=1 Tax=Sphingobium sp. EM0848 TaxID=2743473 RepID=UPI00159C258A|nr:hypothetical protein [Sphingobium sp. EM0848]